MANERITHAIGDNKLLIKKDNTSEVQEYFGLDVDKIIVGVETKELDENGNLKREIVQNSLGLNESRVAVEAQEIYNRKTRKHRSWFILDLETGKRGWFPGCVIKGDILGDASIKAAPDDNAESIETATNITVTILDIITIDQDSPYGDWYKVQYNTQGYVKKDVVSNLRYDSPKVN